MPTDPRLRELLRQRRTCRPRDRRHVEAAIAQLIGRAPVRPPVAAFRTAAAAWATDPSLGTLFAFGAACRECIDAGIDPRKVTHSDPKVAALVTMAWSEVARVLRRPRGKR